jgi:hypothetical protein
MRNLIKIVLAILLFLCLFKMPYGYYQFVRFVAMVSFGYLAFSANEESKKNEVFIYLALAILFQPLIKFSFGRTLWNVIDVIVGVGLLLSIFNKKK